MHDNGITELPENFFEKLPELAWIDMRKNCLRRLPKLAQPNNCLRVLLLQENRLKSLPYSFGNPTNTLTCPDGYEIYPGNDVECINCKSIWAGRMIMK